MSNNATVKIAGRANNKSLMGCPLWLVSLLSTLCIITLATIGGAFTYILLNRAQRQKFLESFNSIASNSIVVLHRKLESRYSGAVVAGDVLSLAYPNATVWPFVYLPGFNQLDNSLGTDILIQNCPILSSAHVADFENYAYSHFEVTYPGENIAISPFGKGIFAYLNDGNCSAFSRYHDIFGNSSFGSPHKILVPILQGTRSSLMFNTHSNQALGEAIDQVLNCSQHETGSMYELCNIISIPTISCLESNVHAYFFHPVHLTDDSAQLTLLLGLTAAKIIWKDVFTEMFASIQAEVVCVLSTGDVAYTFQVNNDGDTIVIGKGDHHESEYEDYSIETSIYQSIRLTGNLDPYTVTIYPTSTFERRYRDAQPLVATIVVVVTVLLFTCLVMLTSYYTWLKRSDFERDALDKVKRQFIRYISHEIRTPLNTLSLGLGVLQEELCNVDNPTFSTCLPNHSNEDEIADHDHSHDQTQQQQQQQEEEKKEQHPQQQHQYQHQHQHQHQHQQQQQQHHQYWLANRRSSKQAQKIGEWRRLVSELIDNSQCAVLLLDDLLCFEQIHEGVTEDWSHRLPNDVAVLPVWDLLHGSLKLFEVRARLREVSLHSALEVEEHGLSSEWLAKLEKLNMLGDEAQIKRVVYTLLTNALQYSQEGGKLTVSALWHPPSQKNPAADSTSTQTLIEAPLMTSWSWLSCSRLCLTPAGYVRFSVTDYGQGMTPEQTVQVFGKDKKFQFNELQAGQGSGISLFVCKYIAEQHHARIQVFSEGTGRGSTYILDLPVFEPLSGENLTNQSSASTMRHVDVNSSPPPHAPTGMQLGGAYDVENQMKIGDSEHVTKTIIPSSALTQATSATIPVVVAASTSAASASPTEFTSAAAPAPSVGRMRQESPPEPYQPFRTLHTLEAPTTASAGVALGVTAGVQEKASSSFTHKRILVVDDAPSNRKMLVRLLSKYGHVCDQAQDGRVAVDLVKAQMRRSSEVIYKHPSEYSNSGKLQASGVASALEELKEVDTGEEGKRLEEKQKEQDIGKEEDAEIERVDGLGSCINYDLILMDYEMPVLNGPDATRELRAMGCACPIVGVTGNILNRDMDYFLEQGADAVLPKPLQISALTEIWDRLATQQSEQSSA